MALDTGAKVLGLNVIETAASSIGMVQKRNFLNDMILHHEEDRLYVVIVHSVPRYLLKLPVPLLAMPLISGPQFDTQLSLKTSKR